MNKKTIMQLLEQKIEFSEEDQDLIECIEEAKMEMHVARQMFESVSDPKLIELAIHAENVAKARYDYLITIAKKKELKKKVN